MTDGADDRLGELAQRWQTDKSPRVALPLAEEYRRQERYDEAAEVLEECVAEHPHSISGRVALGRVLLEVDRDEQAAEVLVDVIDTDPTQLVATKLLVEAFIRLGRADDARERLRYYGLLNDGDPEIPELRRRIGGLAAEDPASLDDTRAPVSAPPEPAAPVVEHAPAAAHDDLFDLDVPAPPPAPAADGDQPFPDLAVEPASAARLEDDDPFDFLAPVPAAAPAQLAAAAPPPTLDDDPFELGAPPAAPVDDDDPLASVLDDTVGAAPAAVAEPVAAPAPEPGTVPADADDEAGVAEPALDAETAPSVATEPEPEPVPEPPVEQGETPAATATLGLIYLRQGHLDEAEEIFRLVLDGHPHHEAARAGLEETARRRQETGAQPAAMAADRPELTAEDLLAGDRPSGLTARKRLLLERYLERIRRGAEADVH